MEAMNISAYEIYWVVILINKMSSNTRRKLANRNYHAIAGNKNLVMHYPSREKAEQAVNEAKELLRDGDIATFLLIADKQFSEMQTVYGA